MIEKPRAFQTCLMSEDTSFQACVITDALDAALHALGGEITTWPAPVDFDLIEDPPAVEALSMRQRVRFAARMIRLAEQAWSDTPLLLVLDFEKGCSSEMARDFHAQRVPRWTPQGRRAV